MWYNRLSEYLIEEGYTDDSICPCVIIKRSDISFSVNLLARYSSSPTRRHWNGVKHTFRYLRGTMNMSFFFIQKYQNLN